MFSSLPGFDTVVGFRYTVVTPDRVELEWDVRPELHQPNGILHGGVHCTAVEAAASVGAATWLAERGGGNVVGVHNSTDFLRAVTSGTLRAVATPLHRGRSQQLWLVEISDDHGRAAARGQVRFQNLTDPR